MTNPQQPDWNPRDPSVLADQRHAYDEMRERCPVAYSEGMGWSLFRHGDVQDVLRDPDTYSNASRHHAIPNAMDGPDHATYRRLLEPYFSADRMTALEQRCRDVAAETALLLGKESISDAIASYAEPVSLKTMCHFLGWSPDWWERVGAWMHGNHLATSTRDREAAAALAVEFSAMVNEAIAAHRDRSTDTNDVTSRLMATEVDGKQWTDEEISDTLRTWIAGHGTVIAAVGILVFHLAEHQELQQRLRDQPGLIPAAVDEILRTDGPLVANRRTATRDVTIADRTIPAGERLSLMWIAANRDDRAFNDAGTVRVERDQQNSLLFGAGVHICLGAPLARLEMRVAIEELLANTTRVSLADAGALVRDANPSNGFSGLSVRIS